ncbi:hypothetical protein [Asaia bogorensis]|uniref:hypothetical protein n=1 Tax=Asaia bogorensis TaxID=91915 RepID=UPI0028626A77|nr:hypothetical protein [Asaia bogorensis]MDR6182126.1 hypothetical protein [Asaia bogorensis NBRC 16594]
MWIPSKQTKIHVEHLLDLPSTGREQDWEIELADSHRIGEFIKKFIERPLKEDVMLAIFAIIISSFNDSLVDGSFSIKDWVFFVDHMIGDLPAIEASGVLDIWNCKSSRDQYEICRYLQSYLFDKI